MRMASDATRRLDIRRRNILLVYNFQYNWFWRLLTTFSPTRTNLAILSECLFRVLQYRCIKRPNRCCIGHNLCVNLYIWIVRCLQCSQLHRCGLGGTEKALTLSWMSLEKFKTILKTNRVMLQNREKPISHI